MVDGEPVLTFSSHRSLAPLLWATVALSIMELCLVHLLVALLWSRWVALGLTVVTLAGIVWIVTAIRSLRRLPVLVAPDRVTMRAGAIAGFGARPMPFRRGRTVDAVAMKLDEPTEFLAALGHG